MKVLFATDGSAYSEVAAKFLTRFDWSPADSITAFHAIYAVPFPDDAAFHYKTLTSIKKDIGPKIIDSAVEQLKPVQAAISGQILEFSPSQCTPDQCIINAAEAAEADLIVMGGRGIRGVASVFLGSVTRSVSARSPLPVLIVKPGMGGSAAMKVLFAADGSPHSEAAGRFLAMLPFRGDAEATILHIMTSGFADLPERFALEINDRIKDEVADVRSRDMERSERILADARAALGRSFRNLSKLSKTGDPSTEVLRTAAAQGADLIVVGCRGLRGIRGMMGSVSRNVLTHAECPVLIGKTCGDAA